MSLMPRLQRPGATNYTNLSPLQQTLAHVGRCKEGRGVGGENIPLLFSLRASSPYGRVARSHASTARERRHACQGWRKLLFLRPSRLRRSLATRNGELVRRLLQWFQFSTKLLVSEGSSTLGSPNLSIAMFLFSHFARLKNGEIITKCHT